MASGHVPSWASVWGQDPFGVFAGFTCGGVTQRMRWIPPGRFRMGSPEDEPERYDDEPLHDVEITRGFWMAETPCTQELWRAVMGENPSEFSDPDKPVVNVSFEDVGEFLARFREREPESDLRLPTEAEWEYACRAGTSTATYAGSATPAVLDPIAWWAPNSDGSSQFVGKKEANGWGLFDMLGNVNEWTLDRAELDEFLVSPPPLDTRDPHSATGSRRVVRGGSWCDVARYLRAAFRSANLPETRFDYLGFRLARGQKVRSSQGAGESGAGRDADPAPSRE
ncbi:MAG: formylglycine-generating enzyme family protein [bacterium]|nr:formylglycine-generating enzyme family protein [bacterium]